MKRCATLILTFCGLLVLPELTFAHSPIKGINNFYNGALHPVLVPAHLLLLIVTSLAFGQQGLKKVQLSLVLFFTSVALGLVFAWFSPGVQVEVFILICAMMIGLLVAASPRLPLYWYSVIAVLSGFVLGFDSPQETLAGKEKLVALFGTGVGVYFFLLYPMFLAEYFNQRAWQKIAIRIIGSWIAASALLVLTLSVSSTEL